ncbi:TIGR04282 family arsenosugar biosynthesis glycosyltransferase [Jiangella rhizosphaerae]|uniref:DUF2064 domain-containing protein n=1 Tax=Jiangella rhizosphaerae TaxID=2293569 RepID=A0A418KW21_9ACTN|nr:DUF2064 domain-containing protein [Jiangella rhizosphaerae]RIQ34855.1 DUF2064 domain-containing protein [Jiangella rhizosphaerae]
MAAIQVLVVAKEPVPGRVKTRLCPPLDPVEAARVAEAALADTLDAVARCGADRRILVLDGRPGSWLSPGFEVVPQAPGPLGARLAAAWRHAGGPAVQLGMDTPQVTPSLLDDALDLLTGDGGRADRALLGPAEDGGWWALGLRRWRRGVFDGVPMSTAHTAARQADRLRSLGLAVTPLPVLRDIDTAADAVAVAAAVPGSRTAGVVRSVLAGAGLR